jgi:hypothetical protein
MGGDRKKEVKDILIIKDEKAIFSTGREREINCGIIGLTLGGEGAFEEVAEGYDGIFYRPQQEWEETNDLYELTAQEQIELADYMISAWKIFKVGIIARSRKGKR